MSIISSPFLDFFRHCDSQTFQMQKLSQLGVLFFLGYQWTSWRSSDIKGQTQQLVMSVSVHCASSILHPMDKLVESDVTSPAFSHLFWMISNQPKNTGNIYIYMKNMKITSNIIICIYIYIIYIYIYISRSIEWVYSDHHPGNDGFHPPRKERYRNGGPGCTSVPCLLWFHIALQCVILGCLWPFLRVFSVWLQMSKHNRTYIHGNHLRMFCHIFLHSLHLSTTRASNSVKTLNLHAPCLQGILAVYIEILLLSLYPHYWVGPFYQSPMVFPKIASSHELLLFSFPA